MTEKRTKELDAYDNLCAEGLWVEAGWAVYASSRLPASASVFQKRLMRESFMAGAAYLLSAVTEAASKDKGRMSKAGLEQMKNIREELSNFAKSMLLERHERNRQDAKQDGPDVIAVTVFDKEMDVEALGALPYYINPADQRPAREQFDANYQHGGGWRPITGFRHDMLGSPVIHYPGDPPLAPIAMMTLREEVIYFYPHAMVAVVQPDGSAEISRMD